MKTVESLLEKGLIEVANKEEELKVCVFSCLERDGHRCQSLKKHLKTCRVTHTHTPTFGSDQHTLSDILLLAL